MYKRRREGPQKGPFRPSRERVPEEFAYILDFLPQGNPFDKHPEHKRAPVAQAIGDKYFTLFEMTVPEGEYFEVGEKIYVGPEYIGKGPIKSVSEPISYEDLTNVSKQNLPNVIEKIIKEKEKIFINVFNIAEPITIRMHMLELIPGIGKKTLMTILDERKKKSFESFKELEERLTLRGAKMQTPEKFLAERIVQELQGGERYYLFLKPRGDEGIYIGLLERLYRMRKEQ